MLQSIRDRTQGWIAGIIISLLILTFALWGIHSWLVGGSVSTTVAKVNGIEISKSQLDLTYERMRRELQAQYANTLPARVEMGLKKRALQALISTQVLKQASFKQGYRISERQIDGFLQSMPEFQENGQFSMVRFQKVLSSSLLSPNDFLTLIQTTLMIDQPRMGTIFTSFALPKEVKNAIGIVYQKRNIQYALLPYTLISAPIMIPDAKIESYYQQHSNEFKTKEKVSVNYIVLSIKSIMSQLSASDNDLKNFYDDNASSFAAPAQWKIQGILVPINKPTDEQQASYQMKQIAKEAKLNKSLSDLRQKNKFVKIVANLQGWVTLDQVPTVIQQALSSITTQQILAPIKTTQGFVLLKVEDYKPAHILSFDEAKQKVKESYLHQKAEEQFADQREKLANVTYEHPDNLEVAAQELKLTIQSSELFTKDKGDEGISANKQVREAAFSNDVLFSQNNSDVIQYTPDSAIVIRIKSHVPAALLPLSAVKSEIIEKLKIVEKENKTLQLAQDIQKQLQLGKSPQLVATQYHFNWVSVGLIGRYSNKLDAAILNTAFIMPILKNPNQVAYAVNKMPNGYVIVELKEAQSGMMSDMDQHRVFAEQIQNSDGLVEYELYKKSWINKSKVLIL